MARTRRGTRSEASIARHKTRRAKRKDDKNAYERLLFIAECKELNRDDFKRRYRTITCSMDASLRGFAPDIRSAVLGVFDEECEGLGMLIAHYSVFLISRWPTQL